MLVFRFIKVNFERYTQSKYDAIFALLSTNTYTFSFVAVILVLSNYVTSIGTFSLLDLISLILIAQLIWYLNVIFVRKSFQQISKSIIDGSIDAQFVKPYNFLNYSFLSSFDFKHVPTALVTLLSILIINYHKLTPQNILVILILLLASIIWMHSLTVIFVSNILKTKRESQFFDLSLEVPEILKYPIEFISSSFKIFVLPIYIISEPLSEAIIKGSGSNLNWLYFISTVLVFVASRLIWKLNLKGFL